jgi:hypothetical protein
VWRHLHDVDAFRGEYCVERCGVFGVSVADGEPKPGDAFVEVHQEVARGLRGPGRSRMRGDAEDVDSAGVNLHHEQHVESVQSDGVEVEEVRGQQSYCLGAREGAPTGV